VTGQLFSRRTPDAPWRPIVSASYFRIASSPGEDRNAPLNITPNRDRYWQIRLESAGGATRDSPQLQVEWVPDAVTFLARGPGPFRLVYGSAAATGSASDLGHLPEHLDIARATVGEAQTLGGPRKLLPARAPFPSTRLVLWSILLLAVLGLAWMAYRLTAERGASHEERKSA
jgi:hypothetical protein